MADRWPGAMKLATAGEYLEVSVDVVERLLRDGAFGAVQFNDRGDRRILKEDLDAWLASRSNKRITA